MTHGCIGLPGRAVLLGTLSMMVALSVSCRPDRSPDGADSKGGARAGASGAGGSAGGRLGSGSAGAEGGGQAGSGGGVVGGETGGDSGGAGGTIASGGSPPADIPCTGNAECVATGQVCESATKLCVPCVNTSDCPTGGHCLGNKCVTFTSCASKTDCTGGLICDTTRGVCVQCTADADCASGHACHGSQCIAVATCQRNSDCETNVCDSANNRCIDCASDDNCGTGNQRCLLNVCRTICTSNADCSGLRMVCDTSVKACKQCVTNKDCPASWYCLVSLCVPDVCDTTQSACNGTSVAGCSAEGDAFNNFTSCSAGKPCSARGAVATCGGTPIRDGGVSDGPASPDAGAGSCSGGTMADPCKSGLPKFAGSQTVDGNGGELCSLPYFVLNAQNAAKVINSSNVPTSALESATARVGWDAAGLHAYVDVQDSSVQTAFMADSSQATAKCYQGDSIELYLSSSPNVTGMTSNDSNTIHLIIPASGPAVSVKDTGNAGTSTALPTAQYAQTITRTGYAIEALIPWPGSAPSQGGAIRFDMSINSADKSFNGIDKMRDAQLIFYIGTVSGSTTCQGSDGTVPWCDNRTWCQTTVQ